MSNQTIQTVSERTGKLVLAVAVLFLLIGVAGYGLLPEFMPAASSALRFGVLIVGVALAAIIALISGPGRRFIAFAKDSYAETRRVVWPSRQETITTTGIVFAFVVVLALFLWLTDKSIEWVLYDLIFGWK